jgi:hypothetical protein
MKPRMQHSDQRGQQHHVAEGTASDCQRSFQTPGTGVARAVAVPMGIPRQPPTRQYAATIGSEVNNNLSGTNSPNCTIGGVPV